MKKYLITLSALIMLGAYADWQTAALNDGQSIQLFNDSGKAEQNKTRKWLPLIQNSVWMQKTFDLTRLPEEWRSNIGSAEVWIYCQAADQSVAVKKLPQKNGLTEEVEVIVNGNAQVLKLSDPVFPSYRNWAKIKIDPALITGNTLTVQIHKMPSATNDDFLYMGVDVSCIPAHSKVSVSSGKSFRFENGALPGLKGEYMIRLVLSR